MAATQDEEASLFRAATAGRAGCLLLLGALLTGCAHHFFYLPTQVFYDTPKRAGLRFEEVSFSSYDGTRLTGWFFPATGYGDSRNAKGTVVHFHDNARNISAHWQYVEWLPRRGFNLFVFDYRGFGASEGIPDHKGVFEDSGSALDYVRSRPDVNPENMVLLGQSIGGANAIAVVGSGNRKGVKAIVIEATFLLILLDCQRQGIVGRSADGRYVQPRAIHCQAVPDTFSAPARNSRFRGSIPPCDQAIWQSERTQAPDSSRGRKAHRGLHFAIWHDLHGHRERILG